MTVRFVAKMPDLRAALARIGPPALIVAIALAGLGNMIWHPEGLFNRHSDLIAYDLGTQTLLHQSWNRDHSIPLWRSDMLSGEPAFSNPQALYTHPLHSLFALFPADRVVGLVIWLQLVVGALGAYYATRAMRLSVAARIMVAMAVLFSFKTILAVYAGWLSMLAAVAAMPMLFGATAIVLERPSVRSSIALGGAAALALHAGHLQLTYYAGLLIGIWIAGKISSLIVQRQARVARDVIAAFALAATVAGGLSAYILIPLLNDAGLMTRRDAGFDFFLGSRPPYLLDLLTFFNPELFGSPLQNTYVEGWEYVAFVGAVVSFFAVIGALEKGGRPLTGALIAGLLLSLILSINTPLLRVVYEIVPGYSLFRLPARMLFVAAFFLCCLSGVGLDRALSNLKKAKHRTPVAALIISLVALEGSAWARRYLITANPNALVTKADYLEVLSRANSPSRIAPLARSLPSYGSAGATGLQLITGYDSFVMRHYQTYIDLLQSNTVPTPRPAVWTDVSGLARLDLLAVLNVLYVVSLKPLELPAGDYALVQSFESQPQFRFYEGQVNGPAYVYKNLRFVPRAFFVSTVIAVAGERAVIGVIQQADVRDTAVVEAAGLGGPSTPRAGDRVEIVKSSAGSLDLHAKNDERRFLVVSEVWHPGWSAQVDGRAADLVRTDIALLGLWLEPGDHRIEIRFWPPGLTAGLVITGVTILGVIFLVVTTAVRRPSKRGSDL